MASGPDAGAMQIDTVFHEGGPEGALGVLHVPYRAGTARLDLTLECFAFQGGLMGFWLDDEGDAFASVFGDGRASWQEPEPETVQSARPS